MPDTDAQNVPGGARPGSNPNARRLTLSRRVLYAFAAPVASVLARLLWRTCRVTTVFGADTIDGMIGNEQAYVPCYWHRDIFLCLLTIRSWIQRGFSAGIIISPSVDGEVPTRIARRWGAEVVRGSAARTGAMAMRELHQVMSRGISIITAADGPVGPAGYFKAGILLTARIGSAPIVPMACAADRAWQFATWDSFVLPKPFARIAIAVGEPVEVPPHADALAQETLRESLQAKINTLTDQARSALA